MTISKKKTSVLFFLIATYAKRIDENDGTFDNAFSTSKVRKRKCFSKLLLPCILQICNGSAVFEINAIDKNHYCM